MIEYTNTHFETYVKEADLKQQILMTNVVPDNLDKVKKLEDFVRGILKDKQKDKLMEETIYPEKSRYLLIWIILEHIFRKQYSCWARPVTASHHLEGITFWKPSTVLHVEEGGHTANKASDWGFFKQYFLDSKKRWRKPACGNL